jgi:hypothetical protein
LKERRLPNVEEGQKNVVAALVLIPKDKFPIIFSTGSTFRLFEQLLNGTPQ